MFTNLYNLSGRAFVAVNDFREKLERGDADSAGSTLRTIGIVTLVLLVVGAIGAAVMVAANSAGSTIQNGGASFNFN